MTFRPRIEVTLLALVTLASICSCAAAKPVATGQRRLIAKAEHLPPMPPPSKGKPLLVVYPRGEEIAAPTSFVCGATMPAYGLTINGSPVATNKQGFFAHIVSLKPGKNTFIVQATAPDGTITTTNVEALKETAPPVMSASPLAFDSPSLKPKDDQGRTAGDIVELSCRATPGSRVTATVGTHTVPMICLANLAAAAGPKKGGGKSSPDFTKAGINPGLSAAYGQVYQRYPARRPDFYVGLYKVQAEDSFVDAPISYKLQKDGQETSFTSAAKLTTIKQPMMARTNLDDTIVRTAPDAGRLTPLPAQVRLMVDGWDGDNIRCLYRAGKHGWIKKKHCRWKKAAHPHRQRWHARSS